MNYKNVLSTLALPVVLIMLVSCTTVERTSVNPSRAQSPDVNTATIQEDLKMQVQRHLCARYNDDRENCGSNSQPALLCNGILIRATAPNPTYHVWENSQASVKKGGVSFSYLRKDLRYRNFVFGYSSGYIFTAYNFVPAKRRPEILCFFPIEAATDNRGSKGCGVYSYQGTSFPGSQPCHLSGITTGDQWWAHFTSSPAQHSFRQCGFDVSDGRNNLAGPAFSAGMAVQRIMLAESYMGYNEFILAAWGPGLGKSLPLEAFFYLHGSVQGLKDAKRNQLDLKDTDGVVIPIISVRLSRTLTDPAKFYYLPADQAVAMPPALP